MSDKVVPNTGWTQEIGSQGEPEDWVYLFLGPFRIHVWKDRNLYVEEGRESWDVVMHYGDSTILKQGFLTQEDACGYALNHAIDLIKGLLTTLEGYRDE